MKKAPPPGLRLEVDELLRKATVEFAEHGFAGMSMRTLAEKCAVSTSVIYYHFASKEDLYAEVCRQKFDEITWVMRQNLAKAKTNDERLETWVSTLYEEWNRDKTLLLLTQRDVINALVDPEHCVANPHYRQLLGMVHTMLAEACHREPDEDFTFTFGSLLFGYCALMSFDRKFTKLEPDAWHAHRKAVLLKYCRRMWAAMSAD